VDTPVDITVTKVGGPMFRPVTVNPQPGTNDWSFPVTGLNNGDRVSVLASVTDPNTGTIASEHTVYFRIVAMRPPPARPRRR